MACEAGPTPVCKSAAASRIAGSDSSEPFNVLVINCNSQKTDVHGDGARGTRHAGAVSFDGQGARPFDEQCDSACQAAYFDEV